MRLLILQLVLIGSIGLRAQSPNYKVYAIRFASFTHPVAISVFSDTGSNSDGVNVAFSIWLVKGDNGKNISSTPAF